MVLNSSGLLSGLPRLLWGHLAAIGCWWLWPLVEATLLRRLESESQEAKLLGPLQDTHTRAHTHARVDFPCPPL